MDDFKEDDFAEDDFAADDFQEDGAAPTPSYGMKNAALDMARPLLEGGGAVVGGVLGAPMGPVGAVGGGALGFAAGKAGADLIDRYRGRKPLLRSLPEAATETGQNVAQGAALEATGMVAGRVIKPILKSAGKVRNTLGEWATGIPSKDFQTLANNPKAIIPGELQRAGDRFGRAEANAGISNELTSESVDRIRTPGKYAFDTFEKLKNTGKITPQEALHARQSIDAIYPVPNKKNGSYIRMLDQIRDAFQDVIANTTPELKQASKDYAIAKSGSRFQAILPQNKSGTPSFIRGGAMVGGLLSGRPESMFMSPIVSGVATAASGGVGKLLKGASGNPIARRILLGGGRSILNPEPVTKSGIVNPSENVAQEFTGIPNNSNGYKDGEQLTGNLGKQPKPLLDEETAREYLKKADGDKVKARKMALADGWSF